mmetsp:Transcript_10432/g.25907  ORF Transcript_10432/g.25907 Transcript_10432/m.25907 type:complete len:460 (+) Transcript_10432:628-2007(+)
MRARRISASALPSDTAASPGARSMSAGCSTDSVRTMRSTPRPLISRISGSSHTAMRAAHGATPASTYVARAADSWVLTSSAMRVTTRVRPATTGCTSRASSPGSTRCDARARPCRLCPSSSCSSSLSVRTHSPAMALHLCTRAGRPPGRSSIMRATSLWLWCAGLKVAAWRSPRPRPRPPRTNDAPLRVKDAWSRVQILMIASEMYSRDSLRAARATWRALLPLAPDSSWAGVCGFSLYTSSCSSISAASPSAAKPRPFLVPAPPPATASSPVRPACVCTSTGRSCMRRVVRKAARSTSPRLLAALVLPPPVLLEEERGTQKGAGSPRNTASGSVACACATSPLMASRHAWLSAATDTMAAANASSMRLSRFSATPRKEVSNVGTAWLQPAMSRSMRSAKRAAGTTPLGPGAARPACPVPPCTASAPPCVPPTRPMPGGLNASGCSRAAVSRARMSIHT